MANAPDDAQHTSTNGYTCAPNDVLFDPRLTLQEQAIYMKLLHVAWVNREDPKQHDMIGVPVQLPPVKDLAEALATSVSMLERHMRSLKANGHLFTHRPSRREPLVYTLRVGSPATDDSTGQSRPEGRLLTRARSSQELEDVKHSGFALVAPTELALIPADELPGDIPWTKVGDPPPLALDEHGRNQAYDALAELVARGSPRQRLVPIALHGRPGSLRSQPGINRLFWFETALHHKMSLEAIRARATANAVDYTFALARVIERRIEQYRQSGKAGLTPTSLASWWLDLEHPVEKNRALTREQIESMTTEEWIEYGRRNG